MLNELLAIALSLPNAAGATPVHETPALLDSRARAAHPRPPEAWTDGGDGPMPLGEPYSAFDGIGAPNAASERDAAVGDPVPAPGPDGAAPTSADGETARHHETAALLEPGDGGAFEPMPLGEAYASFDVPPGVGLDVKAAAPVFGPPVADSSASEASVTGAASGAATSTQADGRLEIDRNAERDNGPAATAAGTTTAHEPHAGAGSGTGIDIDIDVLGASQPELVPSEEARVLRTLARVRGQERALRHGRLPEAPDVAVVPNGTRVLMALESVLGTALDDAPGDPVLGSGWAALEPSELDRVRGGFKSPSGLNVSFGIERAVYLNGELVTTTRLVVSDLAHAGAQGATALAPSATLALVQSGAGNVFGRVSSPGGIGTVIQNTLNDQKLQAVTVIDASVNSLDVMRGMRLQSLVRDAVSDALRR